MSETRKLAAILVADVVGYSRLAGTEQSSPEGPTSPSGQSTVWWRSCQRLLAWG